MTARRSPKSEHDLIEAYRQGIGERAAAELSTEQIRRDALAVVARVDNELARMHSAGALKEVNRSYREYRLQASARGERIVPYAVWMRRYKAKLVRDVAAHLVA